MLLSFCETVHGQNLENPLSGPDVVIPTDPGILTVDGTESWMGYLREICSASSPAAALSQIKRTLPQHKHVPIN